MTYPATTQTAAKALDDLDRYCEAAKRSVRAFRDTAAREPVPVDRLYALRNQLTQLLADIDSRLGVPDLAVTAKREKRDPTLDVDAEVATVRAAILAVRDWLDANLPPPTMTQAELSAFRTLADAVVASVE